ncbi:MAG: hydrogenase nickel incorporation protein HypB [Cyanobacteria bacterium]|jgi:hydrogenase nickel incorporation protein HypB|nr:hydrogenase nickel incorporation protein HypB [Cyanobacteria bacterium GSL.Bin21]
MCENCGCADSSGKVHIHTHEADHSHQPRKVDVHEAILAKNDHLAHHLRQKLNRQGVVTLNFLSSPGSGKTSLIERTLTDLADRLAMAVVVGDLETDHDAQRLGSKGASVVQITTGNVCHLEANMVATALADINLAGVQLLFIENVGNLVCPAAYDLGENIRVVLLSATEGEDKPLKYPTVFKTADVVILNKMDIAEVVGFNRDLAMQNIQKIAPQAEILELSARSRLGIADWYHYLENVHQTVLKTAMTPTAL